MLEVLPEREGIRRTGLHAKTAEGAHREMINMLIDHPYLFSVGPFDTLGDNFDGAVRAVGLADPAPGAAMLVVRVVRHDHLPLKPLEHFQFFPVLRVLLCYDGSGAEKIFSGNGHARQEGFHPVEYIREIFEEAVHRLKNANPLVLQMP